jgi:hypothetical protein
MKGILEIEFDDATNSNVLFAPLTRTIRGRFDVLRAAEHEKNWHSSGWTGVIPSQRLCLDLERGEGAIVEPLHEAAHDGIAGRIKSLGLKLHPARESFTLSEPERKEWLWSMRRLVDSGVGKVVSGDFPREVSPPAPKPGLMDPIDRLCGLVESLLSRLVAKPA